MKRKKLTRISAVLLALIMCAALLPTAASAANTDVASEVELTAALAGAAAGDTITVTQDITVTAALNVPSALTNVAIKGATPAITLRRGAAYAGELFNVAAGGKLTLEDIVLDGGAVWDTAIAFDGSTGVYSFGRTNSGLAATQSCIVANGAVVLGNGSQIQNCYYQDNTSTYGQTNGGAAVRVNATGALTITGTAKLHDNGVQRTTSSMHFGGGAVVVNGGAVTMEGSAEIANNFVLCQNGHGGGILVNSGSVTISGGSIRGSAAPNGGGVSLHGGTLTMNGGAISANSVYNCGGGVAVWSTTSKATFTLNSGTISGNTIIDSKYGGQGGGVSTYAKNDNFIMTGGSIENNTASDSGGGLYVGAMGTQSTAVLLGGVIRGNIADEPLNGVEYMGAAVSTRGTLYLDGVNMTITGDIGLSGSDTYVGLVGAADNMNDFLISNWVSGSAVGKTIVKPESCAYDGTTYTVADAEPYVTHFTHTVKTVVKGSEEATNDNDTGNLVLGDVLTLRFDMNLPAGVTATPDPASYPSITGLSEGDVLMDQTGFPTTDPTLEGYEFQGWYTTSNPYAGQKVTAATVMGSGNMTLYAFWKLPDPNGGKKIDGIYTLKILRTGDTGETNLSVTGTATAAYNPLYEKYMPPLMYADGSQVGADVINAMTVTGIEVYSRLPDGSYGWVASSAAESGVKVVFANGKITVSGSRSVIAKVTMTYNVQLVLIIPGDVDLNGRVNSTDSSLIAAYNVGDIEFEDYIYQQLMADMDSDTLENPRLNSTDTAAVDEMNVGGIDPPN